MKKLSNKDLKIIYLILAIAVLALAYVFGVSKNLEKRSETIEENNKLRTQLNDLKAKEAEKPEKVQETNDWLNEIKAICDEFPSKVTQQSVLFTVDQMFKETKIDWTSTSLSMNDLFFAGGGEITEETIAAVQGQSTPAEGEEGAEATDATQQEGGIEDDTIKLENLFGLRTTVTIAYTATYDDLKKVVDFINAHEDKMDLGSITTAFDSGSGNLSGSMTIYIYALSGNGKTYADPSSSELNDIGLGRDNVFGSFDKKSK